ncbi:hypothetical protein TNCV_2228071 [Trichonephila clavipes]|nr:hypothetical protein TNCV_2228071 [Trichonephila clavipes]
MKHGVAILNPKASVTASSGNVRFHHLQRNQRPCTPVLGVVLLEYRTFCQKEKLNHRVKRICKNASIMVTCDHPLKTTRYPESREDIAPHAITGSPLRFTVGTRQWTSNASVGVCQTNIWPVGRRQKLPRSDSEWNAIKFWRMRYSLIHKEQPEPSHARIRGDLQRTPDNGRDGWLTWVLRESHKKSYDDHDAVKTAIQDIFDSKEPEFYRYEIHLLPERWQDVIDSNEDYAQS